MSFGLFFTHLLSYIKKMVYRYNLGPQWFGEEEQKRWLWFLWKEQFDPCRNREQAAPELEHDSSGNQWTSPSCRASLP